ncbi:MAG: hypothetical protein ACI4U3_10115 [Traorella sp.]
MKKIWMCLGLCLLLTGCQKGYERSREMATINNVDFSEIEERIENDETFMFMCTREDCSSCAYFIENVLGSYLQNHGFELNRVDFLNSMSAEERKPIVEFVKANPYPDEIIQEVIDTLGDYEEGELLTPTLYFVEDGEVKDMLVGSRITEKELDDMIQKYRLDEVK